MLKLKIIAVAVILSLAGITIHRSNRFEAFAEADILRKIAEYKNRARITKEPITVKFDPSALSDG